MRWRKRSIYSIEFEENKEEERDMNIDEFDKESTVPRFGHGMMSSKFFISISASERKTADRKKICRTF